MGFIFNKFLPAAGNIFNKFLPAGGNIYNNFCLWQVKFSTNFRLKWATFSPSFCLRWASLSTYFCLQQATFSMNFCLQQTRHYLNNFCDMWACQKIPHSSSKANMIKMFGNIKMYFITKSAAMLDSIQIRNIYPMKLASLKNICI